MAEQPAMNLLRYESKINMLNVPTTSHSTQLFLGSTSAKYEVTQTNGCCDMQRPCRETEIPCFRFRFRLYKHNRESSFWGSVSRFSKMIELFCFHIFFFSCSSIVKLTYNARHTIPPYELDSETEQWRQCTHILHQIGNLDELDGSHSSCILLVVVSPALHQPVGNQGASSGSWWHWHHNSQQHMLCDCVHLTLLSQVPSFHLLRNAFCKSH